MEAILAKANLLKLGTKATKFCDIALEKSKKIAPENPRHQIAEQSSRQRPAGDPRPERYGSRSSEILDLPNSQNFPPPWMHLGEHIFETSGSKSWKAEADKKWALQRLEKSWNIFNLVVYTNGSATSGTGTGGGGIVVTTAHPVVLKLSALLPFPPANGVSLTR